MAQNDVDRYWKRCLQPLLLEGVQGKDIIVAQAQRQKQRFQNGVEWGLESWEKTYGFSSMSKFGVSLPEFLLKFNVDICAFWCNFG